MATRLLLVGYDTGINGNPSPAQRDIERNPSALIAEGLHGQQLGHSPEAYEIIGRTIPAVRKRIPDMLRQYLDEVDPSVAICMGYDGRGRRIAVETIGRNRWRDQAPDATGYQPKDEDPVIEGGKGQYMATLPSRDIVDAINETHIGISAEVSTNAGTQGCNAALCILIDAVNDRAKDNDAKRIPAGFIHVPYFQEQARMLGLTGDYPSLRTLCNAIGIAGETCMQRQHRPLASEVGDLERHEGEGIDFL